MSDICRCFAPVADDNCRILILGSMPGERSLELQQYYGHKNNRFWRMIAELFNSGILPDDYEERKKMLLRRNIALWDVIAYCRREGSLDSAIHEEEYNDLAGFLAAHKQIKRICCNGGKAYSALQKYCRFHPLGTIEILAMPSTSPANARWNLEKLKEKWASALLN